MTLSGDNRGRDTAAKQQIARVFPRRTRATPTDNLAFYDEPGLFPIDADEVHVSVTFTYDLPRAEFLAKAWERIAPVRIGGPATGMPGGEFMPGLYLKPGYVITSRGCPNRCWFCSAWRREGDTRELPVADGWNVLDDNLLACSEQHIRSVFAMLKRQPRRAEFTGGLEAARLQPWHVELLRELRPKQMFFAYDAEDDYELLVEAGRALIGAGFTVQSHVLRCYVLIGYPDDTFEAAERRLQQADAAGFLPMAMLWRDNDGKRDLQWARFQRQWARPTLVASGLRHEPTVIAGETGHVPQCCLIGGDENG